jgi:mannose-6-phosphate isomerase-like protein (cupin superfamily)
METAKKTAFRIVELAELAPVACPCGQARRAFKDIPDGPLSLHLVEISIDAKTHYHKKQTEVYYILECGPEAAIELDGTRYPVKPGVSIFIPPFTRHRAVGQMKILNIVTPPFDPADEWFDGPAEEL